MRIGCNDNFLAIEKVEPWEPGSPCRVEAVITGAGCRFTAVHNKVLIEPSGDMLEQAAGFLNLSEHRLDLQLSEGGWLRLKRNSKGCIIVHYRLVRWDMWAAMEGEILVGRESAEEFCRELKALLSPEAEPSAK
ncbi:MAG TPA: hypothetical protein VN578_00940 [Candidatus Binatia bacterium]|nr:hypothetical protein [Candidatus Binatia bacterium]